MLEIRELLDGCKNLDRKYQEVFYNEFYGTVYKISMRYSSSTDEAKDNIQDIFMKMFNNIDKFNGDNYEHLTNWVKTLSRNYCIDICRKNKPLFCEIYDNIRDIDREYNDDQNEEFNYSFQEIISAIQKLTPRYNLIFNMFVIDEYSHKEISDLLSISEGVSKSSLYKAKIQLKKLLANNNK